MKTICGMSMRGAAYFGASVHICIGLLFFALLLDRLIYHVYYRSLNVDTLRVDKESVIYFGLFLPLGVLIFKAIDKENKTLLKWASAVFLALQLFGIIIRIKYGYIYSSSLLIKSRSPFSGSKLDSEITLENFKVLSMEIISTMTYLIILYFYARQLESFPGRIYGQSAIPMYSTNSTYFVPTDHRSSRMTTPFAYSFEPPPPYSSVNNLNIASADGQGQVQFQLQHTHSHTHGHNHIQHQLQQPCSSRAMFANIGRNKSFKKNSIGSINTSSNSNPVGPVSGSNSVSGGGALGVTITTATMIPLGRESDSPSAPLLQSHPNNTLTNLKDLDLD